MRRWAVSLSKKDHLPTIGFRHLGEPGGRGILSLNRIKAFDEFIQLDILISEWRLSLWDFYYWSDQRTAWNFAHTWVLSHLVVSDSLTTWTVALQVPLSMAFLRQEYWSGLLFHPPGDLPDPGIKHAFPVSPALQANSLLTEPFHISVIPVSRFKRAVRHKSKKTDFMTKPYEFCVLKCPHYLCPHPLKKDP